MGKVLVFCMVVMSMVVLGVCDGETSIQSKCADKFTELTNCIDYSTGKADKPQAQCCSSIGGMVSSTPECLCYIIQQTHKGNDAIKQLGLQLDRLVQLPKACKLANASLSECPKLLNLTPKSPDYAIFTNTTKESNTPSVSSGSAGAGSTTVSPTSAAVFHNVHCTGYFMLAMLSAILFSIF